MRRRRRGRRITKGSKLLTLDFGENYSQEAMADENIGTAAGENLHIHISDPAISDKEEQFHSNKIYLYIYISIDGERQLNN